MFLLRGIPFVALAYLRKSDICNGLLLYRQRKTGRAITVRLTREAMSIVKRLADEKGFMT